MGRLIRNHKTYTLLGIVFAILAGILLFSYVVKVKKILPKTGELVQVPTAKRDIHRGTVISKDDISMREWPENYLPPGSARDAKDVLGSTVTQDTLKGEPMSSRRLARKGDKEDLSARIPADMRAYTLALGPEAGMNKKMSPGDRVDVLVTLGDPPSTRTILSGKEILELELDREGDTAVASGAASVTLLLSPDEVEALTFSRSQGDISISLCSLNAGNMR